MTTPPEPPRRPGRPHEGRARVTVYILPQTKQYIKAQAGRAPLGHALDKIISDHADRAEQP